MVYLASRLCSLIAYSSNSAAKNYIDGGIFAIAYVAEILHGEKVKILWYYFNAWKLTGLLAVRTFFSFSKDQ